MEQIPKSNNFLEAVKSSKQAIADVGYGIIPQVVGVLVGLLTSILVARGLGPTGLGKYALVLSLSNIAIVLSDIGIGQTATRYASRAVAQGDISTQLSVLRWALRTRIYLVILTVGILFFLTPLIADRIWKNAELMLYLRLGLGISFFAAFITVPGTYFQSIRKFSMYAAVSSFQKLISLAGIVSLTMAEVFSLLNLILLNIGISAITAFIFVALVPKQAVWPNNFLKKLRTLKWRCIIQSPVVDSLQNNDKDSFTPKQFLKYQMCATIIVLATQQADIWMIGHFLSTFELGLYSAAVKLTLPLTIVLSSINSALWPRSSGIVDFDQTRRMLKRAFKICLFVAAGFLAYSIFVPYLIPFLFGSEYEKSRLLSQVLCFRYCISMLACPIGILGLNFGLVRCYWMVNLIQLVAVVYVNLILLPKIGPIASAIALIINDCIGFGIIGLLILKHQTNAESG